jgi:hypothetical protein
MTPEEYAKLSPKEADRYDMQERMQKKNKPVGRTHSECGYLSPTL